MQRRQEETITSVKPTEKETEYGQCDRYGNINDDDPLKLFRIESQKGQDRNGSELQQEYSRYFKS